MSGDATVGIDLGTSNTCMALLVGDKAEIILNEQGDRTTPSVVGFAKDGRILVGAPAWRQAVMNPTRTITAVKRLVGRRHDSDAVSDLARTLPYPVVKSANGDAWVEVDETPISPQEIQAYTLERVRQDGAKFIGQELTDAVITVPAFFDEIQRQSVRDSAEIAGFRQCRVLSEPTAAALAYGYAQFDNRKVVIVDFGGGTLDVTVMSVDQGKFEVLSTDGDLLLGGHDFDRAMTNAFAAEIRGAHGVDVLEDAVAVQRLMSECESAKRKLSSEMVTQISLPYLASKGSESINFDRTLRRDEFNQFTAGLVERIVEPCRRAMREADVKPAQIDDVILVGGMTRTPAIQQRITDLFQRKPSHRVNPDEVVAIGASLLAAGPEKRDDITFVDVSPRTIGLRVSGDRMAPLIPKSTQLPARVSKGFATTQDNQDHFELIVFQGEDITASKNRRLASVLIDDIPKKPKGDIKLRVTFELDADGRLNVTAQELATKKETKAKIRPASGLTRAQVEALVNKHANVRNSGEQRAVGDSQPPPNAGFAIQFGEDEAPAKRPAVPASRPTGAAPASPVQAAIQAAARKRADNTEPKVTSSSKAPASRAPRPSVGPRAGRPSAAATRDAQQSSPMARALSSATAGARARRPSLQQNRQKTGSLSPAPLVAEGTAPSAPAPRPRPPRPNPRAKRPSGGTSVTTHGPAWLPILLLVIGLAAVAVLMWLLLQ